MPDVSHHQISEWEKATNAATRKAAFQGTQGSGIALRTTEEDEDEHKGVDLPVITSQTKARVSPSRASIILTTTVDVERADKTVIDERTGLL
jgi:hypothetical protein